MKMYIYKILFLSVFLVSGTAQSSILVNSKETVSFTRVDQNHISTKYCLLDKCRETVFTHSDFSEKLDGASLFIEDVYKNPDFLKNHIVKQSKIAFDYGQPVAKINLGDVLVFNIREQDVQLALSNQKNFEANLFGFFKIINSDEVMSKFKSALDSNSVIKTGDTTEFLLYKTLSLMMIERMKSA